MTNNDEVKKQVLESPLFTILNDAFQIEIKKIRDDIAAGSCRMLRKERKDKGYQNPNNAREPVNKKALPVETNAPVTEKQAPVEKQESQPPPKADDAKPKEKSALGKLMDDVGLGGLGLDI